MRNQVRRVTALGLHDAQVLFNDRMPLVLLSVMPLASMAFFKTSMRAALHQAGYVHVTGAEQVVPGFAVLSGFFIPSFIGLAFIKEHGWCTWERLQVTTLRQGEIIAAKLSPWVVIGLVHQASVFALGTLVFGLHVRGSVLGLALVVICLVAFLLAFGVFLVSVSKTIQQVSAYGTLGSVLLAGLGGALTPVSALPLWVQRISPATPTYWAMRGFRSVILDGRGVGGVLLPCAVLLGAAAGCAAFALRRFKFEDVKLSWSS